MFTNYQITGAFKESNIWFTPVAVTNPNYLFLLTESVLKNKENINDLSLANPFVECSDLSNIDCFGDIETYLHFNKGTNDIIEKLMFLSMGKETLTLLNAVVSNRKLELNNNIYGKFGTLAINKVNAVHEFPSVKTLGFNISGGIDEILKLKFSLLCNDRNIDSVVNPLSLLRTIEAFEQADVDNIIPISLRYCTILIDDYGNAISTEFPISSINFNFRRNLTGDYVANGNTNLNEIIEPVTDGEHEIDLELVLATYDINEFIENFDLDTFKHAELSFVGPTIIDGLGNTFRNNFKLVLNKILIVNESDIINNAGLQPLTLKFKSLNDEANSNKPFHVEWITNHINSF